jgi:Na+-transporting NADH:ubiquinone oxidoreductase subunit NqrE
MVLSGIFFSAAIAENALLSSAPMTLPLHEERYPLAKAAKKSFIISAAFIIASAFLGVAEIVCGVADAKFLLVLFAAAAACLSVRLVEYVLAEQMSSVLLIAAVAVLLLTQPPFDTANPTAALVYALGTAAGYSLVLCSLSACERRLRLSAVPAPMRGRSVMLAVLALAAMGFSA